ncbi:hypothetical protein AB4Y30_11385 [Ornithinibacillus sp. 4-3]|uniref:Uncharacterized protein n=1 Tax=Ornithinibacillus sp. 4-3 TaxID=3231488 RepID=A0AB39HMJ6_9BACI
MNKVYRIREGIPDKPKNNVYKKLGYNFNALQGGYVSKDLSTIIITHRTMGNGIVTLYKDNQEENFKRNIQILKENNLLK